MATPALIVNLEQSVNGVTQQISYALPPQLDPDYTSAQQYYYLLLLLQICSQINCLTR